VQIVADREIPQVTEAFAQYGQVKLVTGRDLTPDQLGDAEILLVRSVTKVNAALLDGSSIRLVGTATSGTDHLDESYLLDRNIERFDAAGCNARAVAEYILACLILHQRTLSRGFEQLQVGIVGFGHVGKMVYQLLSALGIRCVVNDPLLLSKEMESAPARVSLDEVLVSDVITLHVPYTEIGPFPTHELLGGAELARLKPDALLINAARGGVVDEAALMEWKTHNPSATMAIDCWREEPAIDLRLLRLASFASPHIAGYTAEARLRATRMLVEKMAAKLDGDQTWPTPVAKSLGLHLQGDGHRLKIIGEAVLHCCNPTTSTNDLRRTIGLPALRRSAAFDELRRGAVGRREFSAYSIASESLQPDTVSDLCALGFNITNSGSQNDG
jgi:erythronate-4-phosphate dehydrogenase